MARRGTEERRGGNGFFLRVDIAFQIFIQRVFYVYAYMCKRSSINGINGHRRAHNAPRRYI